MEPRRPEATSYHVVPGLDEGWDVVVEDEHHNVSSTHCSDWHRVERICAALEHQDGPPTKDRALTKHPEETTH